MPKSCPKICQYARQNAAPGALPGRPGIGQGSWAARAPEVIWRARRRPGRLPDLGEGTGWSHGLMKTLEDQFAKMVSVAMKAKIHRQRKVPKVPIRACHPRGGVRVRPRSKFEKWSHYTKFIMLIRNFTTPGPAKFLQANSV